jgi:hypothetical protein
LPPADVQVDLALVRSLLREQHLDLAELPLGEVHEGWDNVTIRLGSQLAVRSPRRELGARLHDSELRWLPLLAPRLPLAEFLRALHRPAPVEAPINPNRGVPLAARDADVRRLLATTVAHESEARIDIRLLAQQSQSALNAAAFEGPPVWVHGDLHPGNIIVAGGEVTGVIDFGDVCAGDPAVDFAVGWMVLDVQARQVLRPLVRTRGKRQPERPPLFDGIGDHRLGRVQGPPHVRIGDGTLVLGLGERALGVPGALRAGDEPVAHDPSSRSVLRIEPGRLGCARPAVVQIDQQQPRLHLERSHDVHGGEQRGQRRAVGQRPLRRMLCDYEPHTLPHATSSPPGLLR